MKSASIFTLLAHGITAHAAVACLATNDNFDDLKTNQIFQTLPLLAGEIGTYHGLNYSKFVLGALGNPLLGLVPSSPPNVAATSMVLDLLYGFSITLNPFGTITAAPSTSIGVRTFDLNSFYFGCVLDLHTNVLAVPETCTVSICGTRLDGTAVPCESFLFTAPAATRVPLQQAVPSAAYLGVSSVIFGVDSTLLGQVTSSQTSLVLDNVCHRNNYI